jgi:hypothetical protein
MRVSCHAHSEFSGSPASVFARVVDAAGFPAMFVGYGPIPAVTRVTLDSSLAVGSFRQVHSADGSQLTEQITRLDPPHCHAYSLSGFSAPFSWLVTRGDARWTISRRSKGSHLRWEYDFQLTHALVYPIDAVLLHLFMARAMQRCVDNMARADAAVARAR